METPQDIQSPPIELEHDTGSHNSFNSVMTHTFISWKGVLLFILLISTCIVMMMDESIRHPIMSLGPEGTWQRRIFKIPAKIFASKGYILIIIILAFHPKRKDLLTGLACFSGIAFGILYLLKWLIGRARPDLGLGPYYFNAFGNPSHNLTNGYDSLPSGHTFSAFILALLVSIYFPKTRFIIWPLALLSATGRIIQERHWTSDILFASFLTLLIFYMTQALMGEKNFFRISLSDFKKSKHADVQN